MDTGKKNQEATVTEPLARPPGYSPDGVQVVVGYGSVPPQQLTDPDMNTVYLSIFTMLFCCWPCGLVGLIYGIQGMQQHYRGQYASAERITKSAKKWTICGIVSGVTYVCVLMFTIVVGYALGFGLGFGLSKDPATDLPTTNAPF